MKRVFLFIVIVMLGMDWVMWAFPMGRVLASEMVTASYEVDSVIITSPPMQESLEVRFNPKAPRQPLPVQDGAACLKEPLEPGAVAFNGV